MITDPPSPQQNKPSDATAPTPRFGSGSSRMLNACVYGASGTTGAEMVRLLEQHPACRIAAATSREYAGKSLRVVDPGAPDVQLVHPDHVTLDEMDVAFLCLPHGHSAAMAEKCFRAGVATVDLSGDLRLKDAGTHGRIYGSPRSEAIASQAIYGLTELVRADLREAKLVSNPGCYPTCAAIAFAPLATRGVLPSTLVIDAKSGASGAGRSANPATHFCAVVDDVRPYKLGRAHRHTAEIEQTLHGCAADTQSKPTVIFCPHVVPIERGMSLTSVVELQDLTAQEVYDLYKQAYADEPFVEVLPFGEAAQIRAVSRTNKAVVGIHPVEGTRHVVLTCAIDNLLKGAAGQALQNMNLMFGLEETLGLGPCVRPAINAPSAAWGRVTEVNV